MKEALKKIRSLSLALLLITTFSCTSDKETNMQIDTPLEINSINIQKKWRVTYFEFTKDCSKANRSKYQVSLIDINLDSSRYNAIDQYWLNKDSGSWSLNGDIVELISDSIATPLRFKIKRLLRNEMELEVLDHPDLLAVELVLRR
ncbi:hypothetical protein SAMN04488018_12531 [Myroides marinus]|uniref:Lipocalin-like domain-containing protein n=1 Tax=Myroides marinus TaxID=703342 RepID=A0A1H6Y869_9FLAO|nr:hypothetical protein [Myroides marinus]SEJ33320.1 hypothetical protein SAMN04488018_12531 [Myroides marinus]